MTVKKFEVMGMSCAACSTRVEKAVGNIEGVSSCCVSLLTNSMTVEGEVSDEQIINAVEKAGYQVKTTEINENESRRETSLEDKETPLLKKRVYFSVGILAILMYFSMGVVMWEWPGPDYLTKNPAAMGLLQLLLTTAILIINQKFYISGIKGLIHRSPNMDTLVALGSGAAMIYSIYALFEMTAKMAEGRLMEAHHYLHEFYFESAAMIVALITVGKMLEAMAKGKTTDALKGLLDLAPKTATILVPLSKEKEDGSHTEKELVEKNVPVEQVKKGDIFVVKPGEAIPVDGIIQEGYGAIDESGLTGESIPADKKSGDYVYGGTINQAGFLTCEAVKVGEDTTLSQIITMMSDVAATKAPIAKVADRVSGVFVPVVIVIAFITICVWLLAGREAGFALAKGISVLVISCPCALGLATPVAIMVGNGVGAKKGILFKTAEALEETGKVSIVALDKTGTITKGEPKVTDILPSFGVSKGELLQLAYSLEKKSEHPLAKAIIAYAMEEKIEAMEVTDFQVAPGNGLQGIIDKKRVRGGNKEYIFGATKEVLSLADELAQEGKTPLFFQQEERLLGVIAVADTIKEDSKEAIEQLKEMGIQVVMVTGDQEKTAKAIGKRAGVDEVVAGVLPAGKEKVISDLQKKGRVAMVGDGINDALALTKAEIGIAIGSGTDIAIDAADVVLMKSTLQDVCYAIKLSRATRRNIHENLFWAFAYNVIGIPLAAGLWLPVFGWELNPMFGAFAMSMSSVCVVTNALRLNLFKMKKETYKKHKNEKGEKIMVKTMKIEGMMCGHCEAAVKKALEAFPQVAEAKVSHEEKEAIITLTEDMDHQLLKEAVEAKDYQVISIS